MRHDYSRLVKGARFGFAAPDGKLLIRSSMGAGNGSSVKLDAGQIGSLVAMTFAITSSRVARTPSPSSGPRTISPEVNDPCKL